MSKIIGNTTATPNPRPDWNQTDANKADYIKNKPETLPNPYALTFTGAATGTYDGSGATTINIPVNDGADQVALHNEDPLAHADIREEISQLSSEIADIMVGGIDTVPVYVQNEAEGVVDKVINAQGSRTFTFAAITDLHFGSWGYYEGITDYSDGIKHACQALKYIDERIKLDAIAVLGDYTDGMAYDQYDTAVYDFKGVNSVLDKLRFSPNLRLVGNHDFHIKHSPLTYRCITAYSDDVEWGNCLGGYFYKDFTAQKIRVICLNTTELNNTSVSPTTEQYQWFIKSLDLSAKENAAEWHTLILSHIPLDFWADGSAYKFAYILNAYQTSGTWSDNEEVACDFSKGNNAARIIGNIHGHLHNLKVDRLNLGGDATQQTNVWRMATPNACFGRENRYDGYQEETTYIKTANSATDTAFCVYCIDLDTCTIKAICYGAGYDRELDYENGVVGHMYTVVNNLTNVANSNTTKNVVENGSYSATLTATSGEITSVVITMGGVDITSTAYSNGNINISTVTGNIVITAVAEADEPEEPEEPGQIINQIPISTDIDGTIYNGKGYKEDTRWSGSGNADAEYVGVDVTGYIPITYGDTIRLKNIQLTAGAAKNEVWYFEQKGTSSFHRVVGEFTNEVVDESGNLIEFTADVTGYMRVVASNIDETSIITINQPISSDEPEEPEEPSEPTYTNQLPISTDADGSIYNGTGYKENTRWSISSAVEKEYTGVYITGYIKVAYGDTVRLKNITFSGGESEGDKIHYFTEKGSWEFNRFPSTCNEAVYDEDGALIAFRADLTGFMRIQANNIDETSIITRNQPIV